MAARLHDLVQGLLVRHAEKHADALLGSSANTTKRAFGAVCKIHFHITELVEETARTRDGRSQCRCYRRGKNSRR